MNPAFDRTLSLLVEGDDEHSPPRGFRTNSTMQKRVSRFKRYGGKIKGFSLPRTTGGATRPPEGMELPNRYFARKMFGGAKSSYSLSTDPQEKPSDDTPAEQRIPPPLKKAETFYDRLRSTLITNKDKFKAGVRKISAKIRRKK